MDEPCSALDPTSTRRIEDTIGELRNDITIVIVTHNMQQAQRVSDHCAFFLAAENTPGHIVEAGPTTAIFGAPRDPRTADYVAGSLRMSRGPRTARRNGTRATTSTWTPSSTCGGGSSPRTAACSRGPLGAMSRRGLPYRAGPTASPVVDLVPVIGRATGAPGWFWSVALEPSAPRRVVGPHLRAPGELPGVLREIRPPADRHRARRLVTRAARPPRSRRSWRRAPAVDSPVTERAPWSVGGDEDVSSASETSRAPPA